jgi:hypothetical protein
MDTLGKKLALPVTFLAVFLIATGTVCAEILVVVKKGYWIEYNATLTGSPPADHDVTWARMEVAGVQGKSIGLNVTTRFVNGTLLYESVPLNLEKGQLGDDFIIPADLNPGETFLDQYQGSITITGVEARSYAGATRTVVYASTAESTYYWDKATGILVEGVSEFPDFTIHSVANKTNIWQPQILDSGPTAFYAILIIAATVIVAVAAFLVLRRKR